MIEENLSQQHIVRSFDEELNLLTATIVRMGGVTEIQLKDALNALKDKNLEAAELVISRDKELDQFEVEVELLVTRIFALRQPMAIDLRSVMSALRIAANLERIGDYVKNSARRCQVLFESASVPAEDGIFKMGVLASQCLRKALDGFQNQNIEIALEAWRQDQEIDLLYNSVFHDLVNYMGDNSDKITAATQLTFVGKNLERIGDLTTNIAEEVYFMVEGSRLTEPRPKADKTSTFSEGV